MIGDITNIVLIVESEVKRQGVIHFLLFSVIILVVGHSFAHSSPVRTAVQRFMNTEHHWLHSRIELTIDLFEIDDVEAVRDVRTHVRYFEVEPLMVTKCINIRSKDEIVFILGNLQRQERRSYWTIYRKSSYLNGFSQISTFELWIEDEMFLSRSHLASTMTLFSKWSEWRKMLTFVRQRWLTRLGLNDWQQHRNRKPSDWKRMVDREYAEYHLTECFCTETRQTVRKCASIGSLPIILFVRLLHRFVSRIG